jgi:predicted RNase H-like HicB family nuclease
MTDHHINIFFSDEDAGYIADIPDLEACSAFGTTPEEALSEVERAKAAWLEAARATGKPTERSSAGKTSCRRMSPGWVGGRRRVGRGYSLIVLLLVALLQSA